MPLKVAWGGGLTNYSSHDKHCTHRIMLTRLTHPRTLYSTKPYGEIVSPRLYVGPLPSKTQRCSIFEAEGGCQSSHSRIFSRSQTSCALRSFNLHPQELEEHTRASYILQSEGSSGFASTPSRFAFISRVLWMFVCESDITFPAYSPLVGGTYVPKRHRICTAYGQPL